MTNHSNNGNGTGLPGQVHPGQGYPENAVDWTQDPQRVPLQNAPHGQIPPALPPQAPSPQQVQYQNPNAVPPEPPQKFIKPKRRTSGFVRLLQLVMSLVFFGAIAIAAYLVFARHEIDKPGPLAQDTVFEVRRGQGLSAISSGLQKEGIIANRRLFSLNPEVIKSAKKLKAGRFAIPRHASMRKVLDILVRGRAIYYKVTLPEGRTSEQAVTRLNNHDLLGGEITSIPPEGSLMPDTYQFEDGAKRQDILERMRKAQADYLAEQWAKRQPGLPLKTPREALILASIVEKETGQASERKRVAGVFVNRLRKGMKLQSDPTIIYGLVGGKGKLGHPLLRSEMKKKTAYNTYQISGLPPTPIANPGRAAIHAVLNPADTKDLYFVADGTGGHAFAPTLKKHNENVRNWRKVEARRRAEKKRREAEEKRLAAEQARQQGQARQQAQARQQGQAQARLPGIMVQDAPAQKASAGNGWNQQVPLPTRRPAKSK